MKSLWKNLLSTPSGAISTAVLLLFLLTGAVSEIHGIFCEHRNAVPVWAKITGKPYSPPGADHFLGTDYQGRDVLLRAIAGTSTALKVGIVSGAISLLLGVGLGVLAGFFKGSADDLVVWGYSTFASMPTLLFILSFALLVSKDFISPEAAAILAKASALLHVTPGMLAVYIAIGLTGWVGLCRVIRAETLKLRKRPFVEAAKLAGVSPLTIIRRHILPNVRHLAIIYFTLNFGAAVMLEVLAGYLGLSGSGGAPSWGAMISAGQERLWRGVWWELAGAGGLMFLLILALNLFGDRLRDALDPRAKEERA